jgi:transcriptional regulator with GAF, ATPase, and Fis domain
MRADLDILRKRINELEYLKSKHEESERILKHALLFAYYDIEKRIEERTLHLTSLNSQLQQEIAYHIRTEYALYYRAEFEKLIATISTNFIRPSKDKILCRIKNALQKIGKFIAVDRGYIFVFSEDRKRIGEICEWCAKGIKPQIKNLKGHFVGKEFPWLSKKLNKRGVFFVGCCDSLPPKAYAEKKYFREHGILSIVTIPMFNNRSLIGCLGFDSVREKKAWSVDIIVLLRIVGEIFAKSLKNDWTEETLSKHEKNLDHVPNIFKMKRDLNPELYHS